MRTLVSAVVALGLVAGACSNDKDSKDATASKRKATTTTVANDATTSTTSLAGQGGEPTDIPPGITIEKADDAVRAWVGALAAGDMAKAWALTAPSSQQAVGGRAKFDAMKSELAEGFGRWGRAKDVRAGVVPLYAASDGSLVSAVVLTGTIAGEQGRAARAVPVRTSTRSSLVDPFVDLGEVRIHLQPGDVVQPDPSLTASVPLATAVDHVWFVVDDRGKVTPEFAGGSPGGTTSGGSGGRKRPGDAPATSAPPPTTRTAVLRPKPPLEPGPHSLTVVVRRGDAVEVQTVWFTMAG